MAETNTRKRPRPVISCLRCRDKKLKCDRISPCENCVKASCAGTCTYSKDAGPTSQANGLEAVKKRGLAADQRSTRNPTSTNLNFSPSVLEDLQARMARVEEMLGVRNEPSERMEKEQTTTSMPPTLLGTLVVKGTRSMYHGQNDRVTLLNQFLEVKDFLNNDISKDEEFQATAKQVKFLQNKSLLKTASPNTDDSEFSLALLKLREFLPSKSYCDRLVAIYRRTFERTMRVLHIPTFMHQYEQIWTNTNPELCTSSSIIPQLTAVLAIAYHMDDSPRTNEDEHHTTYLKRAAIELIQAWLDELGRKRRTELTTLQVETLMVMANSMREIALEKLWSSAGALVRSAMMMGLHTSSSSTPNLTPYQVEMRRRMWATVLEIDLQASMHAGMPNMVPEIDVTDFVPANLNDVDFDESTAILPASRPMSVQTDNTFQVYLANSLPLRLKALSLVHRSSASIDEAVEVGRKIAGYLSSPPQGLSLQDACTDVPNAGGSLLHRVLLDLYAHRPLLYLYKPLLLKTPPNSPTHLEIQTQCLDSSLALLSYQSLYTTSSLLSQTHTHNPIPQQNFFYRCCKNDILWAALTICQEIKLLRQTSRPYASLLRPVETTIECLIGRIEQKGSDVKDIVFLSLALHSVQLPASTSTSTSTSIYISTSTSQTRTHALHLNARKTLAACRDRLMHTVVAANEPAQQHRPVAKRPRITRTSTQYPGVDDFPPTDLAPLYPPTADTSLDIDVDQWFGNVPGLAAEFSSFEGDLFDGGEGFQFGDLGGWAWMGEGG